MRPLLVIALEPSIDVLLELLYRFVELLSECDLVKLLKYRLVETLADSIRLRASRFGPCVFNLFNPKIEFVLMMLWVSIPARN